MSVFNQSLIFIAIIYQFPFSMFNVVKHTHNVCVYAIEPCQKLRLQKSNISIVDSSWHTVSVHICVRYLVFYGKK